VFFRVFCFFFFFWCFLGWFLGVGVFCFWFVFLVCCCWGTPLFVNCFCVEDVLCGPVFSLSRSSTFVFSYDRALDPILEQIVDTSAPSLQDPHQWAGVPSLEIFLLLCRSSSLIFVRFSFGALKKDPPSLLLCVFSPIIISNGCRPSNSTPVCRNIVFLFLFS